MDSWISLFGLEFNTVLLFSWFRVFLYFAIGSSFNWFLFTYLHALHPIIVNVLFFILFFLFFIALSFWHHKMLWYHPVDFLLGSRISHFFRSSGSFYWRMVFETKIWVLGVFVTSEVLLFPRYLSWESKEICVYINQ